MEYTDGMEKIRGYLTEEQINAYEGLTESMDRLSLNLTDRINVLREFLEKEGLLVVYMDQLSEDQKKQFLAAAPKPPGQEKEPEKEEKNNEKKDMIEKETHRHKVLKL